MGSVTADRIANAWRDSAPYWEKHRSNLRAMFAPLTAALLDAVAIEPGHRVLDVAGGPGEPSLTIAAAVGPSGRVVSTDLVEGMVAATQHASRQAKTDNVRFAVCSAQSLPFVEASFDRTVSRLGAMFFPDAACAVREMARVTVHGGRVAFVVWGPQDRNPFFRIPSEELARFVAPDPATPDALDAWRFAEPDALARILREAGLEEVSEQLLPFDIELPFDFDAFWQMRVELADSLREKVTRLDEPARTALSQALRLATAPYFASGSMHIPAEAIVVSGLAVTN